MNIFVLDADPITAAKFHNDRHVVKMILESAQLLSTAHVVLDSKRTASARVPLILRPTHVYHPCAVWVRSSQAAYSWVHSLMGGLLMEYTARYGKVHKYGGEHGVWDQLAKFPLNMEVQPRPPFPQCMPPKYKRSNPVLAYRMYYFYDKGHLASWRSPATEPQWWADLAKAEELRLKRIKSPMIPARGEP